MMGTLNVEMLKAWLIYTTDSVAFKDKEGIFFGVSRKKAANHNTTVEKMLGKRDSDYMTDEDAKKAHSDDRQVMETGQPIEDKIQKLKRKEDGSEIWNSVTTIPYIDQEGKIDGTISIARDITERHCEQEQLKTLNNHTLKMASALTHGIRDPLVSISAEVTLLKKSSYGNDIRDKSVQKILEDLQKRVKSLIEKVKEYLSQSSLLIKEGHVPNKELIDLRQDIIDPLLNELASKIENNEIEIDCSLGAIPADEIIFEANKIYFKDVVENLLINAADKEKGIKIAFGFERLPGFLKVNVWDSGSPVPPGDEEKIFQEGYSTRGSTGIGLPRGRDIMRMHGGDLKYEKTGNHPNFYVLIPV
jgi:hypothetical protein